MVVSLALHAILAVVALSFVAVTVITKNDQKFESRQVTRPRMPPKKLQVPVKIKKSRPKPKLRRRIVVKPTVNRSMPDIKMPEISGIKGGSGAVGGTGLGGVAGIGFSMPEIEVFGVKSKGEKVFLALDSTSFIMYDEVGGIAGYTLIKDELAEILGNLPPTTLFNLAVFDRRNTLVLFSNMVPANKTNVDKVGKWLDPLNMAQAQMAADQFGPKTLGTGGQRVKENFKVGKINRMEGWYPACAEAMKMQADTIFLLASVFGEQWDTIEGSVTPMSESAKKKWEECYQKALKSLEEDNKKRQAKGDPPRALDRKSRWEMNLAYFPDIEFPDVGDRYYYTSKDFREAFNALREKYVRVAVQRSGGIVKKRKRIEFSLNIIQFVPGEDAGKYQYRYDRSIPKFHDLASRLNGQYRSIEGLEGIKSSIGN